jgi:hypothetical protein
VVVPRFEDTDVDNVTSGNLDCVVALMYCPLTAGMNAIIIVPMQKLTTTCAMMWNASSFVDLVPFWLFFTNVSKTKNIPQMLYYGPVTLCQRERFNDFIRRQQIPGLKSAVSDSACVFQHRT